jgi:SAM-dependent methyltransferase
MPMDAVYDGILAEVYDAYTDADAREDLPLWDRLVTETDGPALELGCGTGRVLLPLIQAGHKVHGLDDSADMLALCRVRAVARGLSPTLHHARMSDYSLADRFSLVFSAAGTFTLLAGTGEMERALLAAASHMRPGALLALAMDAPREPSEGPVVARDMIRPSDGARLRCVLEPLDAPDEEVEAWMMTNEVIPPDGGKRSDTRRIAFRRPEPAGFVAMLRSAGFTDVELRDALGRHPMKDGEDEYLVLARRS